MEQTYLLTIHISGAHFSLCLYNELAERFLPETYQRLPMTYKVSRDTVLNIWRSAILAIPAPLQKNITACAIAIPSVFAEYDFSECSKSEGRYETFNKFKLQEYFANLLGLNMQNVRSYYSAIAFLEGNMAYKPELIGQNIIGLHIGSDLSAAMLSHDKIIGLDWEQKPCFNRTANDYLSANWLLQNYYQETEMSVLNIQGLSELSDEHPTARLLMRKFLNNLTLFLRSVIDEKRIDTLILGGDIVHSYKTLPDRLSTALGPVGVYIESQSRRNFHMGLTRLFNKDTA